MEACVQLVTPVPLSYCAPERRSRHVLVLVILAHFWEGNSWGKITWNKWITPYRWTWCISNACLTLIVWDCSQVFLGVCLRGCSISILTPFHIQMKMFSVCWNGVRYSIFGSSLLRTEGRAICLAIPPLLHSLAWSGRMMYVLILVAPCRWCLLEWWVSRIGEVVLMFQAHTVVWPIPRITI